MKAEVIKTGEDYILWLYRDKAELYLGFKVSSLDSFSSKVRNAYNKGKEWISVSEKDIPKKYERLIRW